jgi:hypothetical protein
MRPVRQLREATIELLEAVLSMQSVPRCYKQAVQFRKVKTRVEAGSNTSTVTLRVVGGNEKEVSNPRQ